MHLHIDTRSFHIIPVEWRLFGTGRRPFHVWPLRTRFSDLDDRPAGLDMHKDKWTRTHRHVPWFKINKIKNKKAIFNLPLTHDAKLDGVADSTAFGVHRCAGITTGMRAGDSPDNQTLFHNDNPSSCVFSYGLSLILHCWYFELLVWCL